MMGPKIKLNFMKINFVIEMKWWNFRYRNFEPDHSTGKL